MGRLNLLVVEDNAGDIELIRRAFQHHNFDAQIHAVQDGEIALAHIDRLDQDGGQPPDGVLLDLSLPKIDGIEVLQRIRTSPVLREIPVLVLSGSDNPDDRAKMLQAGATEYLVKPVGLQAFLQLGATVKEMLGHS